MSKKELIATELDRIPEAMLDEVLDFVRFLGAKAVIRAGEPALLSEAASASDPPDPRFDVQFVPQRPEYGAVGVTTLRGRRFAN